MSNRVIPSREVPEERLLAVSCDLWGVVDYGKSALSLLRNERQHAPFKIQSVDYGIP